MDTFVELGIAFLQMLVGLLAIGAASERGTQIIKEFLRVLGAAVPVLNFADRRSFFLAALVAGAFVIMFGLDLTQWLPILDGYDPALVDIVNTLLVLFVSNLSHDKWFKSEPVAG